MSQARSPGDDQVTWVPGVPSEESIRVVKEERLRVTRGILQRTHVGGIYVGGLFGAIAGAYASHFLAFSFWVTLALGIALGALAGWVFSVGFVRRLERKRDLHFDSTAIGFSRLGLYVRTPRGTDVYWWGQVLPGSTILPDGTTIFGLLPVGVRPRSPGALHWSQVTLNREQMIALLEYPFRPRWHFNGARRALGPPWNGTPIRAFQR